MVEKIKKALYAIYSPDEQKGIFLSLFGENQQLLWSQWVLTTDKPLHELIDILYQAIPADQQKALRYVVADIVSDVTEVLDVSQALTVSADEFGFAVVSEETNQSGVILPKTSWVSDAKSALYDLKQKYAVHGQASLYLFRTQRIIITK